MTASLDPLIAFMDSDDHADQWAPRVLYVDVDDDLPDLLDRVEEAGSPAIVVLPDGARAVRGTVAARLLRRRAVEAGVPLVVVSTDRAAVAQLRAIGIPTASTVGEARRLLPTGDNSAPTLHAVDAADAEDAEDNGDQAHVPLITPVLAARKVPAADSAPEDEDEDEGSPAPTIGQTAATAPLPVVDAPIPVAQVRVVQTARAAPPDARPRRRGWLRLAGATLLTALIGVALWAFVFPQATITISYSVAPYDRTYRIMAGGSAVPVHTTHLDVSDALLTPATGTALVPDRHATGTVTFANPLDGYVSVPAGTIVTTSDGIAFATLVAMSVPRAEHSFTGTTNGQQSVQVEAVQAGPGSNVPAYTITRVGGRLAGVLLVTNYNATGGGTMRTVYSITQQDADGAAAILRRRLTAQAEQTLAQRYARSPARDITGIYPGAARITPVTQDGRLYARVTLPVRVTMEYLHRQDVRRVSDAKRALDRSAQNLALVPGSEQEQVRVARARARFVITIQVHAQVVPAIDTTNLRGLLAGRDVADARQLLDGSARYGNWRYTLTTNPDWSGRMPQTPGLIHIAIRRIPLPNATQ
jgi:hypothetical protein